MGSINDGVLGVLLVGLFGCASLIWPTYYVCKSTHRSEAGWTRYGWWANSIWTLLCVLVQVLTTGVVAVEATSMRDVFAVYLIPVFAFCVIGAICPVIAVLVFKRVAVRIAWHRN